MRTRRSELLLFSGLIALCAALYAVRWLLFPGEALHNEMWRFLIGDIAFLFLQVALVTLVIDRLLRMRERQSMLRKLNMVIGAFFSEVGTELLGRIAVTDENLPAVRDDLVPNPGWDQAAYTRARRAIEMHQAQIDIGACNLHDLKAMLIRDKMFVLGLLGNQSLLEHEAFTELLWAVTHLVEELEARPRLEDLPHADRVHLAGDVKRVYTLLTSQWLAYLRHLQTEYPHLFSLAVRTNPLDPDARVIVNS